jgi:cytochrome P450
MFAAANRDPRKWAEPDRFETRRDLRGDLGWGFGLRPCVGRTLAPLEADALLGALIKHIERFEPAGEPEPWTQARRWRQRRKAGHDLVRMDKESSGCSTLP